MGYDFNRFTKALTEELLDLADSGVTTFARPLSEFILSKAEDQGIVLTQEQLESLQQQLKDKTKEYYDAVERGITRAETDRTNPGGSAYWKRTAANAKALADNQRHIDKLQGEVESLSSQVDSTSRDRDTIGSSPIRSIPKVKWGIDAGRLGKY